MRLRPTIRRVSVGAVALAALVAAPIARGQSAQAGAQTFHGGAVLVPVDVRVLDRKGKPVTDLTARDFTVLEDGVVQHVDQFLALSLTPDEDASHAPLVRAGTGAASPPRRLFLIVLGRGRLQVPAKGLDGAIHFVRDLLLPQDQVAVLAWDRATEFTSDREPVIRLLERYKTEHPKIESRLQSLLGGLAGVYGAREVPQALQQEIDAVFSAAGVLPRRTMPGIDSPNQARLEEGLARTAGTIGQQAAEAAVASAARLSQPGPATPPVTLTVNDTSNPDKLTLDELADHNSQTLQDLGKLYAGIDYLRQFEGEKHLVFLAEQGLFLPSADDDRSLAAAANDSRVVVDIIRTGGIVNSALGGSSRVPWEVLTSARVVALTGGVSSGLSYAAETFDRIDAATRFTYELGYTPANPTRDGKYRHIVVRVNWPGLAVLSRHGYFADTTQEPLDRQRILTYSRIASAGRYDQPIPDIGLKLSVTKTVAPGATTPTHVIVSVTIDLSRVSLAVAGGRHVGRIDVAAFCGSGDEDLLGQAWQTINLNLTDETLARLQTTGLPYTVSIPINGPPHYVKVVVYDYGADLLGTAVATVK